MSEIFVVGAIACVDDHLARSGVYGPGFHSGPGGGQRGALGAMDDVEDLFHLVAGLAEHVSARDVRLITFRGAASIHHHDGAFFDDLWSYRAVREGGVFADLDLGAAFESELSVGRFY